MARESTITRKYLGLGLLPQAGVAIGLILILIVFRDAIGSVFRTISDELGNAPGGGFTG